MAALEKGITRNGEGFFRQDLEHPRSGLFSEGSIRLYFAFETNSERGSLSLSIFFIRRQEEFILVQGGMLDLNSMAFGFRPRPEPGTAAATAFRTAISTNRTSLPRPCSGCHPPGSWRRCSTSCTI